MCGQVWKGQPSLPGDPAPLKLVSALQAALEARSGPSVLAASAAQMAVLLCGVTVGDMVSLMRIFVETLLRALMSGLRVMVLLPAPVSVAGRVGPDVSAGGTPLISQGRPPPGLQRVGPPCACPLGSEDGPPQPAWEAFSGFSPPSFTHLCEPEGGRARKRKGSASFTTASHFT